MIFDRFIDRQDLLERIKGAFQRQHPQFVVIYGRRRIGKSTLIKEILMENDVYFLSDQTNEANQRILFAKSVSDIIPVSTRWFTLIGKRCCWN